MKVGTPCSDEFARPVCEERPDDREVVSGERDLVVVEAFDGSDHLGEHAEVEPCVERLGLLDEGGFAEPLREHVDVGEVAGLGTTEEGG